MVSTTEVQVRWEEEAEAEYLLYTNASTFYIFKACN